MQHSRVIASEKLGYMLELSSGLRLTLSSERAGSQETISREVGYTKRVLCNLTKEQRDVLVGLVLGDGNLEYDGYRGTRLQVKQSEARKEYVLWLYRHFAHMTKTPPKQRSDTRQWYFGTRFYEDLEDIRQLFYREGEKVVPPNIAELFDSPVTLAVWFMDDGRLDYREKSHYAYHISTDSFSESDVQRLQELLLKRFGIAAKTYLSLCRGKHYAKLYIGTEGRDAFSETVAPYLLDCFAYKAPPQSQYILTPQRLHAEHPEVI